MSTNNLGITPEDIGQPGPMVDPFDQQQKPSPKRQQFLDARRLGIGGSDAASLFPEDSKYGCPTRLWYEKRGYKPDFERTDKEKKILDRGNRLEDVVADMFSEEFGFKLRRQPTAVHKEAPHLRVNIDRQIVNVTAEEILVYWPQLEKELPNPCGPGVLEVKTSNEWVVRNAIKEGIIPDYIFQIQHGLMVKNYNWGVMAVGDTSSFELTAFPMLRKEPLIQEMRQRADRFWALVENGPKPEPPNFPAGDKRCSGCIFRKTCRGEQWLMEQQGEKPDTGYVSDDSYAELASDLRDIREQKAIIEQTEENIIATIKARMEQEKVSKLEIPSVGARIRWAEQSGARRWDSKALEAEGGTVARKEAFADWVAEHYPDFLLFWMERKAKGQKLHLADRFKVIGSPTRPFVSKFM